MADQPPTVPDGFIPNTGGYGTLLQNIGELYEQGRSHATQAVNQVLVETYWGIGRQIVEFEQHGEAYAKYGSGLLAQLKQHVGRSIG